MTEEIIKKLCTGKNNRKVTIEEIHVWDKRIDAETLKIAMLEDLRDKDF